MHDEVYQRNVAKSSASGEGITAINIASGEIKDSGGFGTDEVEVVSAKVQ